MDTYLRKVFAARYIGIIRIYPQETHLPRLFVSSSIPKFFFQPSFASAFSLLFPPVDRRHSLRRVLLLLPRALSQEHKANSVLFINLFEISMAAASRWIMPLMNRGRRRRFVRFRLAETPPSGEGTWLTSSEERN